MSITEIDRSYAALRKDRPAEPADALVRLTPATARGRQVPRWLRRGIGPVALVLVWHLASITGVLPAEVLAGYHGRLSQTSAIAQRVTGSPSVAEASALALAERSSNRPARLWITKRKSANATLAVARSDP